MIKRRLFLSILPVATLMVMSLPVEARFLQTDPVGQKADVDLYAYTGNDPVNNKDPTGLYTCSGSKDQCGQIQGALDKISNAASKLKDSKEKTTLENVVKFYGKAGDDNGVGIKFGDTPHNAPGATTDSKDGVSITFNIDSAKKSFGGSFTTEFPGTVAHEGQHGSDLKAGANPYNDLQSLYKFERKGFETQSLVNKGLNASSPYGLWQKGWGAGQDGMREAGVSSSAWDDAQQEWYDLSHQK